MEVYVMRILCICTVLVSMNSVVWTRTLLDIFESESDLSDFYELIKGHEQTKMMLRLAEMTVFAPTNSAFRNYRGSTPKGNHLLSYHLVKSAITSDRFPATLPSEIPGGLPIWVKQQDNPIGFSSQNTYYANNGRIIRQDIRGESIEGYVQILHIIDEVLEPTMPQPDDPNFRNPSAFRILSNPTSYGIIEQLNNFEQRVTQFRRQMIFQGGDGHTFFFPVEGNNNMETWNRVDDKVIDGHVIPDKVLFTKAFPTDPQETLLFNSNIMKVLLVMKNDSINNGRGYELSIQSHTVMGPPDYPRGTVVAKIVRANIPVKNGVVHLIENPLVIINKNLFQLLQQNPQLREFYDSLQKYNGEMLTRTTQFEATLFAPSNEAFQRVDANRLAMITNDERRIKQMLNLHLVPQKLTTEMIIQGTSVAQTYDTSRKLHFRHTFSNVTVVGGGVNATITTPDIGATNGIIHIINQVLGIPYHSIYEKLSSDPSLSETFTLGNQRDYNEQFRQRDRIFTYFVPHNDGWNKVKTRYPSEYYKLNNNQYFYHVHNILNRHLIVNQEYTMQDLLRIGSSIKTVNGEIDVYESNGRFYVRWDGEISEILDPDVETNNGRVHVIKDVLFKQKDLTTNQAPAAPFLSLFTFLLTVLVARYIV